MEDNPHAWSNEELSLPNPESKVPQPTIQEDAEAIASTEVSEKALAVDALDRQPVAVFEHAAKAAEEDKPLEKLYELRHELKDEPTQDNPTPIKQVIAGMPKPPAADRPAPPEVPPPVFDTKDTTQPPTQQTQPPVSRPAGRSMYRQAVVLGFCAGVGLLLIFVFLQMLT